MIQFSLTNEQKKQSLQSLVTNLEIEIYNLILLLGEDPDTYDQSKIASFSDIPSPSTEEMLFNRYTRYNLLKEKISTL
jgi:hypothetical protein